MKEVSIFYGYFNEEWPKKRKSKMKDQWNIQVRKQQENKGERKRTVFCIIFCWVKVIASNWSRLCPLLHI